MTILLSIGFLSLIIILLYSFYTHHKELLVLHESTQTIYNHPLKVSSSALLAKLEIYKIHRNMKDVVLTSQVEEIKILKAKVNLNELEIYKNLDIIKTKILGIKGQTLEKEVRLLFKQWRPIRDQVFTLQNKNALNRAIAITKGKGALHVLKLDKAMHSLYLYAHNKAKVIINRAEHNFKQASKNDTITIVLLLILSLGIAIFIIITIRHNQQIVNRKKERYEYAINGTEDGLWDWNLVDDNVYFAPQWKKMLGYDDNELENCFETWKSRVHPDDLKKAEQDLEDNINQKTNFYSNIHRLKHKDGSWVWIHDRGKAYFNDKGIAIRMVGFHTDITQEKELSNIIQEKDELLIIQSRHAAMGEMIGMIAHQWRQPISVISMAANNLLVDVELENLQERAVTKQSKEILFQTKYLSEVIETFKDFFRKSKSIESVVLSSIIDKSLALMQASFDNHGITTQKNYHFADTIETSPQELQQVIINILKNAKESILESNQPKGLVSIQTTTQNSEVIIAICNEGPTIDEKIITDIFNPYTSTKLDKNGTGLGLYISKTITEKHLLGRIWVENRDNGVCFYIALPLKGDHES